jgi:hypothetical protein
MADQIDQRDRATITVQAETKERAKKLKRDGLTWDAFLRDAMEAFEEQSRD